MRRKAILWAQWLAVLGLVFSLTPFSFAQSTGKDRIVRAIDDSSRVTLQGNVRPMFRPENDMGPVEDSFKLENISLMFKLTQSQQADLAALLDELQNSSSPNYHKWLTPEQFADRFGLSPSDVGKVVTWLQAQGFTVTQTARSRTWVSFSGTAAQVHAAFQTEIHRFSLDGKTYYANATEPSVPGAFVDVLLAIHALDNYSLKPASVVRKLQSNLKPDFTSFISGNTYVSPADFAVIYDVDSLYAAGIDGTGQSIAVMGQSDLYSDESGPSSDITAFRSASGLPANLPQVILIPGASDPGVISGDVGEATGDVEWAGAVAKNATIIYVNGGSNGVLKALQYAIANNSAPVISISYGLCEADWGAGGNGWGPVNLNAFANLAQEANTQGQTIVAAAGDSGAAGCEGNPAFSGETAATHGLAVIAPASFPNVTGMGGTEFNEGSGVYWAAATNGVDVSPSALSYIPETAWNDVSSPFNTSHEMWAGGGGASANFAKPSWQTGTGVPNDNARDVPDLSLNASFFHDGSLFCVQGSCVSGFRDGNQHLSVGGGTSVATPCFAGIVALINQKMNTPNGQGNVNPILYSMAATTPAAFHDITTGNNAVPCQAGTPDCPNGGSIGYTAGVGYDQASGLGSIDAFNLVIAWGSSVTGNLPAPVLTVPANGAAGVALSPSFSWTAVTGNAGYRILIATSPADLSTNPATTTCSTCTIVDTTSTNANSYTPPSALAAGMYFWQVQALEPSSSSGTAAWSNIFSFTTNGPTLAAPTLTAPADAATGVSLTPTFSWTPVTGNAGYLIFIATTQSVLPTNPAVEVCQGCATGTITTAASYTPPSAPAAGNLAAGTYYWQVKALSPSSGAYGAWSSVSSFTTVPPDFSLSASPSTLTLNAGNSGTSTLTLTPMNGLSGSSVSFSCSTSSTLVGVTCSVGALNSNNTAIVTITASSLASNFPAPQKFRPLKGWPGPALVATCLFLMALFMPSRRNSLSLVWRLRLRQFAFAAMLVGLLVAGLGCGSSGVSTTTTSESGTVTVQGTGPSTKHSVAISVTVVD
jgi:hypothetical protein